MFLNNFHAFGFLCVKMLSVKLLCNNAHVKSATEIDSLALGHCSGYIILQGVLYYKTKQDLYALKGVNKGEK